MKTLNCHKCGEYLGEIEKGKIKNGTVLFCKKCFNLMNALNNYKNTTNTTNNDFPSELNYLREMLHIEK